MLSDIPPSVTYSMPPQLTPNLTDDAMGHALRNLSQSNSVSLSQSMGLGQCGLTTLQDLDETFISNLRMEVPSPCTW